MSSTDLIIKGIDLSGIHMHECRQQLEAQHLTKFRRSINGRLLPLGVPLLKYKTIIEIVGEGLGPLAPEGSQVLEVHSIQTIQEAGQMPSRPVVPGTLKQDHNGVIYAPILSMHLLSFSSKGEEWSSLMTWTFVLEEV